MYKHLRLTICAENTALTRMIGRCMFVYSTYHQALPLFCIPRCTCFVLSYLLFILHISYRDHVTNEEVRAKIQQAIGPHKDLLTIVKRRKLQWYGHVSCSSGLAKTILRGTVKGGRRQGRERKTWEDNIKEWTGLEFA